MPEDLKVPVPLSLLLRFCTEWQYMSTHRGDTYDQTLMQDLDRVLADFDRTRHAKI